MHLSVIYHLSGTVFTYWNEWSSPMTWGWSFPQAPDVCIQEDVDPKINRFCLDTRSPHAQVCTVKWYIHAVWSGLYPGYLTSQKHLGGFRQVYDLDTTAVGSAAIWRGRTSPGAKAKSWWRLRSMPKTPACNIDKLSESGDIMMTLLLVHWVSHIDMTCKTEVCILQQHVRNGHVCYIMRVAQWWFWVWHHVATWSLQMHHACGTFLCHSSSKAQVQHIRSP